MTGRRRPAALAALALAGAVACKEPPPRAMQGQGDGPPPADTAPDAAVPADTAPRRRTVIAVDLGGFADEAAAVRVRDSLAALGWEPFVRRTADAAPWRVRVAPSREREIAAAIAGAFTAAERQAQVVMDTTEQRRPTVQLHPVNNGTHGMMADLRWAFAEGRRGILVVEDPVSIEADPLPDGFLLADERTHAVMQRDSVWDVAPSPDWQRVAFGRAFVIPVGGRNSAGIGQWMQVSQRTNLNVDVVRRGAFPVSGMSGAVGFAQPVVEALSPDSTYRSALVRQVRTPVPMSGGWRVRWSRDGRTLAVGLAPTRAVADDAEASAWVAVDAESFASLGALQDYVALASIDWTRGPRIELTTTPDPAPRRLEITGGVVESRGGWVTVRGAASRGRLRVLGPGTALAATRDGEFVLALAPPVTVREGEPRSRAVVYQLVP